MPGGGGDEDDALDYARTLLSFLPDNNLAELPVYENDVALEITDEDREILAELRGYKE